MCIDCVDDKWKLNQGLITAAEFKRRSDERHPKGVVNRTFKILLPESTREQMIAVSLAAQASAQRSSRDCITEYGPYPKGCCSDPCDCEDCDRCSGQEIEHRR